MSDVESSGSLALLEFPVTGAGIIPASPSPNTNFSSISGCSTVAPAILDNPILVIVTMFSVIYITPLLLTILFCVILFSIIKLMRFIMTIIAANLYKALKSAGVDEALAEKASEEVISFDKKLDNMAIDTDKKYESLRTDMKVLTARFNIIIGLVSASFLMMLGLFIQNLIK